jgi:hypothetical protein
VTPDPKRGAELLRHAAVLETSEGFEVHVARKQTDPMATRISCGGGAIDGQNFAYCTYRGPIADAIRVTRNCLAALMALEDAGREPDIAPDDGKEYA